MKKDQDVRFFSLVSFVFLSHPATGLKIADVCTHRPTYVAKINPTTLEFTTFDGIFRTVGDVETTKVMLRNLLAAMSPEAEYLPGIHVRERRGGITYLDAVTYDDSCRLLLVRPSPAGDYGTLGGS